MGIKGKEIGNKEGMDGPRGELEDSREKEDIKIILNLREHQRMSQNLLPSIGIPIQVKLLRVENFGD